MQHLCVTIEDVLEDVFGVGWATAPHTLTAAAAVIRIQPGTHCTVAAESSAASEVWGNAGLGDGWVAVATAYHSYGRCGLCVYTQETYVARAVAVDVLPSVAVPQRLVA